MWGHDVLFGGWWCMGENKHMKGQVVLDGAAWPAWLGWEGMGLPGAHSQHCHPLCR